MCKTIKVHKYQEFDIKDERVQKTENFTDNIKIEVLNINQEKP